MKSLKEAILSVVTELDTSNPNNIDILRIALSSEESAITLYNRLAELATDENIKKILLDVSKEEKVHVHEFQALIREFDKEDAESEINGYNEVKDKIDNEILERICTDRTKIADNTYLEVGQKFQVIKKANTN